MPTDKRARQKEGKALRQAELERWRKRRGVRRRVLIFGGAGVVAVGALYVVSLRADDEEAASDCPPVEGADEPARTLDAPPPDSPPTRPTRRWSTPARARSGSTSTRRTPPTP